MQKTAQEDKIFWRLLPIEYITWDKAHSIQQEREELKICKVKTITILSDLRLFTCWFKAYGCICYIDDYGYPHRCRILDEDQAIPQLNLQRWKNFQEQVIACEGTTLESRYGYFDSSLYWVKHCVVPPLNYGKIGEYNHVTKIDISSAYPYELSKRLPTLNGCEVVEGYISPNEQFPFAFYSDGNLAFIEADGRYIDTMILRNSRYYTIQQQVMDYQKRRHSPYKQPTTPTTILCKATEGLTATANWYYNQRTINPNSKQEINLSIGFMHKNKSPKFAHIAAVVLARCVNRMITMAEELENRGNKVTLIATDSIAWQWGNLMEMFQCHYGFESEQPTTTKSLGCAYLELKSGMMLVRGPKAYQTYNNLTTTTITKWSGKPQSETAAMSYGDIRGLEPQLTMVNTQTGATYLADAKSAGWYAR